MTPFSVPPLPPKKWDDSHNTLMTDNDKQTCCFYYTVVSFCHSYWNAIRLEKTLRWHLTFLLQCSSIVISIFLNLEFEVEYLVKVRRLQNVRKWNRLEQYYECCLCGMFKNIPANWNTKLLYKMVCHYITKRIL